MANRFVPIDICGYINIGIKNRNVIKAPMPIRWVFWRKIAFSGDDLRNIGCVDRSSAPPIGNRRDKLKFSDAFPMFPIILASTGNLGTSIGHRAMVCRLGVPPSRLWNRQSFEIGRRTPDDLQIAGRFQRVSRLQSPSPDASPTSGRCPAYLYTIGCRLMSPLFRLASFSRLYFL